MLILISELTIVPYLEALRIFTLFEKHAFYLSRLMQNFPKQNFYAYVLFWVHIIPVCHRDNTARRSCVM